MKKIFLFITFIASITLSSSGGNIIKDSLNQAAIKEDSARERAMASLKQLEKFYAGKENALKKNIHSQQELDSLNKIAAIYRQKDSLTQDSIKQKAKFEKNQKIHNIENTLNAYGNRGFTIYDGIIYFTLFIILLFVYLYFRKMYKNKKFVFKEFYILWKQKFKELRDKERESEREKPNKKNK